MEKIEVYLASKPYERSEVLYLILASTFAVLLVLTNIIGVKLFQAPFYDFTSSILFFIPADANGFALTAGILTYPLTFLITDIVSEIWGERRANFMVIIGFLMSLLMLVITQIGLAVEPHVYWASGDALFFSDGWSTGGDEAKSGSAVEGYQHAFETVFSLQGILLFGSMTAYMCAQLLDVRLFHFWRKVTKGKYLWLRNNGSTVISQFVDTAIVNSIFFYLGLGMDIWIGVQIMLTIYVYKILIALIDTPLIYLGVHIIRKKLVDWGEIDDTGKWVAVNSER